MFNIVAHLTLALGLLWYQRRMKYEPKLRILTIFWYGAGTLLIFVESFILTGDFVSSLLLQGMVIELFYILPMYLSFRHHKKHKHDIFHAFFFFLVYAAIATLAAGWMLANANVVGGINGLQ